MKRRELEHLLRAAGSVARDHDFILFGSQAIWGLIAKVPKELAASMEADLYPRTHPQAVTLIQEALGRPSRFHRTYGYFADSVAPELCTFPNEWEKRLKPFRTKNTGGVTAWCVEIHDVAVSKLVAGRPKDLDYIRALLKHKIARLKTLQERITDTNIREAERADLLRLLETLLPQKPKRKPVRRRKAGARGGS